METNLKKYKKKFPKTTELMKHMKMQVKIFVCLFLHSESCELSLTKKTLFQCTYVTTLSVLTNVKTTYVETLVKPHIVRERFKEIWRLNMTYWRKPRATSAPCVINALHKKQY